MRRVGLGRRSGLGAGEDPGDPLEGIVNLFDVGIVLAAAALIAALGATAASVDREAQSTTRTTPLATPAPSDPRARGSGEAVGTVYRLSDGRLVLVPGP